MNKSLSSVLGGLLVGCLCIALVYFYQQKEEQSLISAIIEDEREAEKHVDGTDGGEAERLARPQISTDKTVVLLPERNIPEILGPSNQARMESLAKRVTASYEESTQAGDYERLLAETASAVNEIKTEYRRKTGKEMYSYLDTSSLEKQADQALKDRLIAPEEYADYLASLISAAEVEHMLIAE